MYGRVPRRSGGEGGFVLTEIAVSLPLLALLLTFLAVAVAWSWRSYQREVAEAQLRQEMQSAAVRILESALLSDAVRAQNGVYEMRQNAHGGSALDRYWLRGGRVVLNHETFPITGAFSGAGVHITSFSAEEDPQHPRLYHIEMTGTSAATGTTYHVRTAVYLREDMGGT